MCQVVKVVTEHHFLRTESRPVVLGPPQAPLTSGRPQREAPRCKPNMNGRVPQPLGDCQA